MVEHSPEEGLVVGSIPTRGTLINLKALTGAFRLDSVLSRDVRSQFGGDVEESGLKFHMGLHCTFWLYL